MKRFVPFVLVFGLITGLSCSSDDGGGEAASMTRSAEAPAATDGSDTVDLTMQSDLDDLEERIEQRIQELEDQLANLPAGPAGPQGPAGPAGADGADGADGNDGATGPQGPAGPAGPTGPQGPAGATGATGAAGAAGADGSDGALAGLTCNDEEFVATLSNSWQCAELGVTNEAQISGSYRDNGGLFPASLDLAGFISDINSNPDGWNVTTINLDTTARFDRYDFYLVMPGVLDYGSCSLNGSFGPDSFVSTSANVTVNATDPNSGENAIRIQFNDINIDYVFELNGPDDTGTFAISISCGQGVVAAQ